MILTREQIALLSWYPEKWKPGTLVEVKETMKAYHDLRDAMLTLCDAPDGAFMAAYVLVPRIREVVARVERGTDDPVS